MAEVVVEEAELNTLYAARKLLEQINGNPQTRSLLTKAIKVHYPNTRTDEDVAAEVAQPYIDQVEATASRMEAMMNKLAERDARDSENRQIAEMDGAFNRLKSQHGYNDEGIEQVKRLMVDRSIPDPEAAAALFERLNPTPVQTRSSWEPDRWNLESDAVDHDVAGLFANPDKWEDAMIGKILIDERSGHNA